MQGPLLFQVENHREAVAVFDGFVVDGGGGPEGGAGDDADGFVVEAGVTGGFRNLDIVDGTIGINGEVEIDGAFVAHQAGLFGIDQLLGDPAGEGIFGAAIETGFRVHREGIGDDVVVVGGIDLGDNRGLKHAGGLFLAAHGFVGRQDAGDREGVAGADVQRAELVEIVIFLLQADVHLAGLVFEQKRYFLEIGI